MEERERNSSFLRIIPLLIAFCLICAPIHAKYSGGTGEPNDPYQIATAADLIALGEEPNDYDKHFILTADIDMDPNLPGRKVFYKAVIAPDTDDGYPYDFQDDFQGKPFSGHFDGRRHVIRNLYIQGRDFVGLFGQLDIGAVVANLGLEDVVINGHWFVGGLAGLIYSGSQSTSWNPYSGCIFSCYSTGSVGGSASIGGLVGRNDGGSIWSCYSTAAVSGDWDIGGLTGFVYEGRIWASYSTGPVSGYQSRTGGLVGGNFGTILSSYSTGTVSGNRKIGGLVGDNDGIVTSSFWDTETSGLMVSEGGIGLTSVQMQDIKVYMDADWDFVGERTNGTCDFWLYQEGTYPTLAFFSGLVRAELQGAGTRECPYLISDANELGSVCYRPLANYRLTSDIDLSGITWDIAVIPWFGGSLDGNHYCIRSLYIRGTDYLGLFGTLVSGAEIMNLHIVDVSIEGTGDCVGGLAGYNDGSIASSYCTGMVSGMDDIGGLAGGNNAYISLSYSTGTINGNERVGGLVGDNSYGIILSSYSTGAVSGNENVGGLAGYSPFSSIILSSYSTGEVTGENSTGGLVGGNGLGSISSSFWDTQTSGLTHSAGGTGLTTAQMQSISTYWDVGWDSIGQSADGTCDFWQFHEGDYPDLAVFTGISPFKLNGVGTAENPYLITDANELGLISRRPTAHYRLAADIDLSDITWRTAVAPWFSGSFNGNQFCIRSLKIEGADYLGFFGVLAPGAEVTNLRLEEVSILGTGDYIGGLVGENDNGSISSCYSTGEIRTDESRIGGLVGSNNGNILSSYSSGTVSGYSIVGGLVGENIYRTIRSSYSAGMINGDYSVGGLVGYNHNGTISSSYSTCAVDGKNDVGGLVGQDLYGSFSSCFWDIETSGQTHSAGSSIQPGHAGGSDRPQPTGRIGLSTAQMQEINTYLSAVWDFVGETANGTEDLWQFLPEAYPSLAVFSEMVPVELEGSGTPDDPYLIKDANELGSIWYHAMDHCRLTADIDLSGTIQRSSVVPWFGGSFDGNGFRIRSLHIKGGGYLGLFGILLSGAEVTNLGLEDVSIEGTGDCIGGLAADSSGSISFCFTTGMVSGNESVGGLVGSNSGYISSCYSACAVIGDNYVGGLVATNHSGIIVSSFSTGMISGESNIGGLAGDCHTARGNFIGISSSFWDMETSGQTTSDGGIGKTTTEMQKAGTFLEAGWDFLDETANGTEDIWWIDEGVDYPHLWWETE